MESSIKIRINKNIERAEEVLLEAEALFNIELYNGVVTRGYYVIFHSINAILLTKSLSFSKHSAVISFFGNKFIREGLIDKRYYKMAIEAFDARQIAEYDIFKQVNKKFALKILEEAKEFIKMAKDFTFQQP